MNRCHKSIPELITEAREMVSALLREASFLWKGERDQFYCQDMWNSFPLKNKFWVLEEMGRGNHFEQRLSLPHWQEKVPLPLKGPDYPGVRLLNL